VDRELTAFLTAQIAALLSKSREPQPRYRAAAAVLSRVPDPEHARSIGVLKLP